MSETIERSPQTPSKEERLESTLQMFLDENPIPHIEGMLSPSLIQTIKLHHQSYLTSYAEYFRTGTQNAYESAELSRREYSKVAEKVRKELKAHKGIDEQYVRELLQAYVEGENRRFRMLSEYATQPQSRDSSKKKPPFKFITKGKVVLASLAALSTSLAYQEFNGVAPFPLEPSVSPSGQTGERPSARREVTERYTAEVLKDQGAIETLTRILGQMTEAHKRQLFAALETPLPETAAEQADALSRRLNLLSRQGSSALIPQNSYFTYNEGTLTLHTPYKTFELIHDVVRGEDGAITRVQTRAYDGRFTVQSR